MKKYWIASFIVIVSLGLSGGYYLGDRWARIQGDFAAMAELVHESALQTIVLTEGTDAAREEAVLEQIAFEERRHTKFGESNLFPHGDIFDTDLMFSYARLARFAKRQGNEDRSKVYLDKALSLCATRPAPSSRDSCTEAKMLEYATNLGRRTEDHVESRKD